MRRAKRAQQAAQAISLAALLLLFLACSLYLVLVYTGWNEYTAAAAVFCAGLAGYPALALLWFALSAQMFSCWRALSPHDRYSIPLAVSLHQSQRHYSCQGFLISDLLSS